MSNEISQSVDDDLRRYGQIKTDYDDLRTSKANQTDLDTTNTRLDNIVTTTGDSNIEIVDARQDASGNTYTNLKNRLDTKEGLKADKTYVDSQDLLKADKTYVDTNLATKANQSDLDSTNSSLALKANQSDLNTTNSNVSANALSLANKAQQTDLSSISLIVRSSGADDTTNINNAINTVSSKGGGTVLLSDPNYLALNIQLKSNVALVGNQTTITKNGGDLTTNVIQANGTVTGTPTPLSADASMESTSVSVASSTGFNVGDYVLVRDGNYIYSNGGRNQEILRIVSITSTTISFSSLLIGSYAVASSAEIVKISPIVGASVKGIIMNIPQGTSGGGFYGLLNFGTIVERCKTLRPYELPAFWFDQSSYCYVKNCISLDGQDIGTSGHGYGFEMSNSVNCFGIENYSERVRENPITYRSRYCGFLNCIDKFPGDDSFNTHGTGNSFIYIKGNWSIGSATQAITVGYSSHRAGDSNIFIEDNTIINSGSFAISINSPTTGLLNNTYIKVKNNNIYNFGSTSYQGYGVNVSYTDNLLIEGNTLDGQNNPQELYAVALQNCTKVKIVSNDVLNCGYGIMYNNCTDVSVERNTMTGMFSYAVRSLGTNTNVRVRHNTSDKNSISFTADVREANIWGTKRDRDKGGTSVADGGTIPHNCASAPSSIRLSGTVAGQIVTISGAPTATNFTVAIKNNDGTVGTTQTVYWEAEV